MWHSSSCHIEYGVQGCNPTLTPTGPHFNLQKSSGTPLVLVLFRGLVCCLFWIAQHTHPEIMRYAVWLAQPCTCYERTHCLPGLRVLKYMYTAKYKRIAFGGGRAALGDSPASDAMPCIYSDSDLVMGSVDPKSYYGNVANLNRDRIIWFTFNQHGVVVSSTKTDHTVVYDVHGRIEHLSPIE